MAVGVTVCVAVLLGVTPIGNDRVGVTVGVPVGVPVFVAVLLWVTAIIFEVDGVILDVTDGAGGVSVGVNVGVLVAHGVVNGLVGTGVQLPIVGV